MDEKHVAGRVDTSRNHDYHIKSLFWRTYPASINTFLHRKNGPRVKVGYRAKHQKSSKNWEWMMFYCSVTVQGVNFMGFGAKRFFELKMPCTKTNPAVEAHAYCVALTFQSLDRFGWPVMAKLLSFLIGKHDADKKDRFLWLGKLFLSPCLCCVFWKILSEEVLKFAFRSFFRQDQCRSRFQTARLTLAQARHLLRYQFRAQFQLAAERCGQRHSHGGRPLDRLGDVGCNKWRLETIPGSVASYHHKNIV